MHEEIDIYLATLQDNAFTSCLFATGAAHANQMNRPLACFIVQHHNQYSCNSKWLYTDRGVRDWVPKLVTKPRQCTSPPKLYCKCITPHPIERSFKSMPRTNLFARVVPLVVKSEWVSSKQFEYQTDCRKKRKGPTDDDSCLRFCNVWCCCSCMHA